MIRIAVCDDEKKILDEVEGYIKNYAEKENDLDIEVFRFDSAKTLISAIEDGKSFASLSLLSISLYQSHVFLLAAQHLLNMFR